MVMTLDCCIKDEIKKSNKVDNAAFRKKTTYEIPYSFSFMEQYPLIIGKTTNNGSNRNINVLDIFLGFHPLSFRKKPMQKKGNDGKARPMYQP